LEQSDGIAERILPNGCPVPAKNAGGIVGLDTHGARRIKSAHPSTASLKELEKEDWWAFLFVFNVIRW